MLSQEKLTSAVKKCTDLHNEVSAEHVHFSGQTFDVLRLEDCILQKLTIDSCQINRLIIKNCTVQSTISIENCHIEQIEIKTNTAKAIDIELSTGMNGFQVENNDCELSITNKSNAHSSIKINSKVDQSVWSSIDPSLFTEGLFQ